MQVDWDIERAGRPWRGDELRPRVELLPEKFEVIDGELLWSESEKINFLGVLLEAVGLDAAVRLGRFELWEEALAAARGGPREMIARRPSWQE